jgi:uncharacterized protein YbbC (DUF1343 family)
MALNGAPVRRVRFGIDELLATPDRPRGPLGLVTNDAARPGGDPGTPGRLALLRAGFPVARLFTPEHGLGADAPDGAPVPHSTDSLTRLPVTSLYGENPRPAPESLGDLQAVLFDLPDVGARFYTYIWTLSHVMEACAEAGVPLLVLDRPNPLGGVMAAVEGPVLDVDSFGSFVGRSPIPIRHSLTSGELARFWKKAWKLDLDLRIVPCQGWRRSVHWPDTGLPFIPTSPSMPTYESALLYPGLCLLEATNLSVGRGTHKPFRQVGAPWLLADETTRAINELDLPGVRAAPCTFTPALDPYAGQRCGGVLMEITDPEALRPVALGLHLLSVLIRTHPGEFRWTSYPTAANPTGEGHFERLVGRAGIREVLEASPPNLAGRIDAWTSAPGWQERVEDMLLYDEWEAIALPSFVL